MPELDQQRHGAGHGAGHVPTTDEVMARLTTVHDPCSVASGRPINLVDMGMVERVEVADDGSVDVHLRLTSPACYLMPYLEAESVRAVSELPGVRTVVVHPDEGLDWSPRLMADGVRAARALPLLSPASPNSGACAD